MPKPALIATLSLSAVLLVGCAPEVGSKKWCENMKAKPKGEWSMNEASEFAKNCIFPKE